MSESRQYIKCQDDEITKLHKRKLTNINTCKKIEMREVTCTVGVLCEYLKDSRVKVTCEKNIENEDTHETRNEVCSNRIDEENMLCVCTDASVKGPNMAGYVMMKDENENMRK